MRYIDIQNRRYLGNKYRLLQFIRGIADGYCEGVESVCDLFAGTGTVAAAFTDKQLITNDLLYCNYICHIAWFSPEDYDARKVEKYIDEFNRAQVQTDNYMSTNFANTYFSLADCRKIGFVRERIQELYDEHKLSVREWALLITSLLYGMDKIAVTCGHYDAFRKVDTYTKNLELAMPRALQGSALNPNNKSFNFDANVLIPEISVDLLYLDPPYNSRQYGLNYHVLENVARWTKPEVRGVTRKMACNDVKSSYSTVSAARSFENLIESAHARYIMLSYNNMGEKGSSSSQATMSDDDILRILTAKGHVQVFSETYRPFSAGRSDIQGNEERVFLCTVHT